MFWNKDELTVHMLILKLACSSKQTKNQICLAADCSPTDTNDSLEGKFNFIF